MVDSEGRLLGLNALRLDGGLILAVPADARVKERVLLLGSGEAPAHHRLGVAVAPPRAARRMRRAVGLPDRDGLLVREVAQDGPADRAGVRAGDLTVAAGNRVDGVEALYAVLDGVPAGGGTLRLTLVRGTDERSADVDFAVPPGARGMSAVSERPAPIDPSEAEALDA